MRYFLIITIIIFALIAGCSGDTAKETTKETVKDVKEGVENGISNLAENISEAAPDIQEDITTGFWNALDMIGEALDIDTGKPLPVAGDTEHRKLHSVVDAAVAKSVVDAAQRVEEQKISDITAALNILEITLRREIMMAGGTVAGGTAASPGLTPASGQPDTSGTTSSQQPSDKIMPTPEQVQAAWESLAKTVDRPAAVRRLFNTIINFVNTHPEYKSQAGIAGPVAKEKIGQKAQEFLAKLKVGEVSKPFKFMKGYLIVQVIDDTPDKIEVGYIYMPEEVVEQAGQTTSSESGTTESSAP